MNENEKLCGILAVNKHAGVTSSDVVVRLRRLYGTRQIGHTGTLDPMATGVLPVLVGRAVKASDYLTAHTKRYEAEMLLGVTTDTEDTTGTVLTRSEEIPEEEAVLAAAASFVGEIRQIPPMVSALKVNGQKLADLARRGVTVERQPRPVTILSLTAERIDRARYRLDVRCTKGTYIRTLCADIGRALGCGAAMAALCRTESGAVALRDTVTLAELEAMTEEERLARLIPLERAFEDLPALAPSDFYARLLRNGCAVSADKLGAVQPAGTLVRLMRGGEFFALGRVLSGEDGAAVKAEKIFVL